MTGRYAASTDTVCTVDGCSRPVKSRGWCATHYKRWQKWGDPLKTLRVRRGVCSVDGCDRETAGRGWCKMHYQRWGRDGTPGEAASRHPGRKPARPCPETVPLRIPEPVDIARLAATWPEPGWRADAACADKPSRWFFPERDGTGHGDLARARDVCAGCPVRYACLTDGLDEAFGIRGGTSERQRRRIRAELVRYRQQGAA